MSLLWFEIFKIFSQWRTYISFATILVLVLLIEVAVKLTEGEVLFRTMRSYRLDFLISGNILNAWFITALIMNSLHVHIPFLIALVAGDMVSGEATSGTVRFLLIRPPSRARIITAKYVTALLYTFGVVAFLGAVSILAGFALFGSGDLIARQLGRFGIVVLPEVEVPMRMGLAFASAAYSMTVVASLAFLLSALVENSIAPIIGTIAVVMVFFVMGNLPFDVFHPLRPYLFTTHMNLWQRFLDDPIPWKEIAASALILGLHNIGLFLIALETYKRKDIKS